MPISPISEGATPSTKPVWATGGATFPSLRGAQSADLCVVGLGGSGLAAISAGLEQGMSVIGLDAGRIASGAAGRNGGFLLAGLAEFHHRTRARFGSAAASAVYASTADEIERMVAAGHGVRRVGSLRIAADDAEREDIKLHCEALLEDGFPAERYIGPEGDGLLVPGDSVFDPEAWYHALAADVVKRGAALFEGSRATKVESGRVYTDEGEVTCTLTVVAVDGHIELMFPELVDDVATWRLQMLATAPVGRRVTDRAVYFRSGLDYWQQLPDGRIAIGGGRDKGGLAEQGAPEGTSAVVQEHLESLVRNRLGLDVSIDRRWSGLVAFTGNGLPLCREIRENVFALGAYSGTGNVVGALCGREAVARLAGGPSPFLDILDDMRAP